MEDPESHSFLNFISNIYSSFQASDIFYLAMLLLLMIVALIVSALISASEIAFFSLEPNDIKEINEHDPKKGKLIEMLLETPKRLLATILIGNNAINITLIIISSLFVAYFEQFGGSPELYLFIQIVVVTALLLLFGEIVPKVYATQRHKKLALITVRFIFFLNFIFKGLSKLLVKISRVLDYILKEEKKNLSIDELSKVHEMIQDYHHNEQEQKMLAGILELGNADVKSIMQPRMEINALSISDPYQKVKTLILESGYSRIPVYEDAIDKIIGILYIKDLLPHLLEEDDFNWTTLLRAPFFIPENKKLDDALKEFQEKKIHLAIVLDEYGGTMGLVTLEDVIEEIVGEIKNEFDDDDLEYSKLDDGKYIFDATILLKDMCRITDVDNVLFEDNKGDSETIAGFILELKGDFPKRGEVIDFNNYRFVIEEMDRKRIKRVKFEILVPVVKEIKEISTA